jgi:hypothetical protein
MPGIKEQAEQVMRRAALSDHSGEPQAAISLPLESQLFTHLDDLKRIFSQIPRSCS